MVVVSCTEKPKGNPDRFKYGTFVIPEGKGHGKTIITRKDNLQIEEYFDMVSISSDSGLTEKKTSRIDTLFITWKNNFAYRLKMKNPKKDLDKETIFVQITKVTDTSYSFTAKVGYTNFKQKGTAFIKNN